MDLYSGPVVCEVSLNWDYVYAVALGLRRAHSDADLHSANLGQVFQWTLALPTFRDDPALCNDEILASIY